MRSFCSKKKFHCPSKVAAARCVMLRTWILGGSSEFGEAGATQEPKLLSLSFGTGQLWSFQTLLISVA